LFIQNKVSRIYLYVTDAYVRENSDMGLNDLDVTVVDHQVASQIVNSLKEMIFHQVRNTLLQILKN
jgi:hypothetical protein